VAREIVLYRVPGYWLTNASIGAKNGLSVCSGDSRAEWYVKVAPAELPRLLAALQARQQGQAAAPAGGTYCAPPDLDAIMDLLLELFGNNDKNPFEAIKQFLAASGIPWKGDFWGAM
jgi:hypothetical protein